MKEKDEKKKLEGEEEVLEKKVSRKELEKANEKIASLQEENEKLKADAASWKNEYYKAYADTQNLRKSLEADAREASRYRSLGFLENLIPALNAFHMALESPAPSKEAENYLIGFTYIYNQLYGALESEGVKEIAPKVGDPFDMGSMHAVETEERDDVPAGTITKVLSKGYKLHERLITAAMVVVSAKKKEEEKAKEDSGEKLAEA